MTRYSYTVDVDVDDESGDLTVFVHGLECGEVGQPINGNFKRGGAARLIGAAILRDVYLEHFGQEMKEPLL